MSPSGKWDDLVPRILSGAAMAVLGILAIIAGGVWFGILVVVVVGILAWELASMVAPDMSDQLRLAGILTGGLMVPLLMQGDPLWCAAMILPAAALASVLPRERGRFVLYYMAVVTAGFGLFVFRENHGMLWLFWLVAVVIATDVLGYFAGRIIGGPKFWPAVSPKKTWSGTAAGWIGAGLIGWFFISISTAGRDLVWISMLVSFASQMGDAAESAFKRKMGVKDSSNLIPGHGGLYDRFDGLLGASLFVLFVSLFVDVPRVDL